MDDPAVVFLWPVGPGLAGPSCYSTRDPVAAVLNVRCIRAAT